MNFVCIVFELGDKMLTLSSMENLIVPCNLNHRRIIWRNNVCNMSGSLFSIVGPSKINILFYRVPLPLCKRDISLHY